MEVLVVAVLLISGFWLWARGETLKRQKRTGKRYPKAAASTATPRAMAGAVRQISTYTHNSEVAARLLQSTRKANMGKSLDWCAEKVIEDILRDRR
ncbi:MAG: hypothetical protein DCF32_06270 [Leptolyngbya sp.]|nr:MAG: hypothetical protein DCF32_06270 [Leptolyngbya sp.]